MKILNIITLAAIAVIGFMLYRLIKKQKEQEQLLSAVAVKSGVMKLEAPKKKASKQVGETEEEEAEDRAPKKVNLKKIQRQVVSLFDDGIPKQLGEARKIYIKTYGEIEAQKFNNTLYNLKPIQVVNAEKVDDNNYWGLDEWFDDDGSFYEEYLLKIPGGKELLQKEEEEDNNEQKA